MMTEGNSLPAVCGLYCGACPHHRASFAGGGYLLDAAVRQGRSAEGYLCGGCRSGKLYIHPGCAQCAIRACATARGLVHCGLCPELPCDHLLAFQHDGHVHHLDVLDSLRLLAEIGPAAWLAAQAERWTCACGAALSWYETVCPRCGAPAPGLELGPPLGRADRTG